MKTNLNQEILRYLDGLSSGNKDFEYSPINGINNVDSLPRLGFSCYALKIYKLLNFQDVISNKNLKKWIQYLNSFQNTESDFPLNSYIDKTYIFNHKNVNKENLIQKSVKKTFNKVFNTNYKDSNEKLSEYINAESKQTISTIYEMGYENKLKYLEFPNSEIKLNYYLNSLNWNYPWSSGGQFSGICLFSKTQLEDKEFVKMKLQLEQFLENLVDQETGFYFKGSQPKDSELINGAMKIISGIDWIDGTIHYPEKIIDYCLNVNLNNEACDVVDLVYVIYKCSTQTNYKRKEIAEYLNEILDFIFLHFKEEEGGFSYFKESCQTHYYDVKFSDSLNIADLHGTLLFTWAIVMILEVTENKLFDFNIIKP